MGHEDESTAKELEHTFPAPRHTNQIINIDIPHQQNGPYVVEDHTDLLPAIVKSDGVNTSKPSGHVSLTAIHTTQLTEDDRQGE